MKQKQPRNQLRKPRLQSLKQHQTNNLKELSLINKGFRRVVGIDEVGRGAWAGPVVLAGFVYYPDTNCNSKVTDSKRVNLKLREKLALSLRLNEASVLEGSVERINQMGVGKVITELITELVSKFDDGNTAFLIDGYFVQNFHTHAELIKKGDSLHYSIAAASIIAKVYRDNLLRKLAQTYQGYGFERNVGYGTKEHRAALQKLGIVEIHRQSFLPIKLLQEQFKLNL